MNRNRNIVNGTIFIILVNYKTVEHTVECIASINSSMYKDVSIIVVDNASGDNCRNILEEAFKDITVIENDKNYGFAIANNIGIKYALEHGADYIMLLNNDTILDINCLSFLVDAAIENKRKLCNQCIVTAKILNYYKREIIWYAGGALNDLKGDADSYGFGQIDDGKYDKEIMCSFASGCCIFGASDIFRQVILPEDYFLYYEDVDFCKKLIEENINIIYNPKAIVYHKESISTQKKSKLYSYYFSRNRLRYIKKNIKGIKKLMSYIYTYMWLGKKILCNDLMFKPVMVGILDFWKGYCADEHSTF